MGLLATLKVMLGIDSLEYQAKLREATGDTEKFAVAVGASVGRVKERVQSGIGQPLLLAGLAAQKFGGQLTSTFSDAAGVTSKLAVQTNGLFMATGRLADAGLLAVASFGKLSAVKLSTATLNAGMLGLATSVGAAAYEITKFIMEVSGLEALLRDFAGKPASEFAEALANNEERFKGAAEQLAGLTAKLQLSGPAWAFEAKWTRENAIRVSELTDKVITYARSRRSISENVAGYFATMQSEERLHRRAIATLDELRLKFQQFYGVMTKPQITDALAKLAGDVQKMAEQGIPWAQVMDKVAPRFKELADFAGTYTNFNMPKQAQDLGDAFRDDTGGALDALLKKWATLPSAIKSGAEDSAKLLDELGERLKGSISGGFGKGIEEGTNFARQQMEAWIAEVEGRPIKLRIDASAIQAAFDAVLSGRIPHTTGSAP